VPEKEPVHIVEDLVSEGVRARPEIEEARLQVQNTRIGLEGSRNEVLPQLDIVATAQSMGLNGQPNALVSSTTSSGSSSVNPATLAATQSNTLPSTGGLGTGLSQIFSGRYPEYSIGVQLTLPLRNRIALADVARDEIVLRQWDVAFQQLQNQIRLEVEAAIIALEQARTAYDAAVENPQVTGTITGDRVGKIPDRPLDHPSCDAVSKLRSAGTLHRSGCPWHLCQSAERPRTSYRRHSDEQ
jgi:outer membrane protein